MLDGLLIAVTGLAFLSVLPLAAWLDGRRRRRAADELTALWDDKHYLDSDSGGGS